ncbi:hypothetical protein Barb7_00296 [Bacteroidales bacterium Barb7]|nr:hypothetical protein Barb7_00296 [Bacteroidales bacterium Barb7]
MLDAGKVDNTITVNGHALTADVTVSKADVGLGNADNTADADKPVSTAQLAAITDSTAAERNRAVAAEGVLDAGKVDNTITVNGHALTADVTVSKADVGLGNADNTADADKPVSTAQLAAITDSTAAERNRAVAAEGVLDAGKVDNTITVNGHALTADVTVSKADVGLGNADNTADADKPVSTAQLAAITDSTAAERNRAVAAEGVLDAGKVDNTITVNGHALTADVTVSKADVGLGNADNTADADKPVSTAQLAAITDSTAAERNRAVAAEGVLTASLDLKADTADVYTKDKADTLLAAKTNRTDFDAYKSEVSNEFSSVYSELYEHIEEVSNTTDINNQLIEEKFGIVGDIISEFYEKQREYTDSLILKLTNRIASLENLVENLAGVAYSGEYSDLVNPPDLESLLSGTFVEEAPINDNAYFRKNGAWETNIRVPIYETATVTLISNQSTTDAALIGTKITSSYAGNTYEKVWNGSPIEFDILPNYSYTITPGNAAGYKTPEGVGYYSDSSVQRYITFEYKTEKQVIYLSSNDLDDLTGQTVTVKVGSTTIYTGTWSGSALNVYVPYDVQFTVSVSDKTGYSTPASQTYTASQLSREYSFVYNSETVNISLSANDGASVIGKTVTITNNSGGATIWSGTWNGETLVAKVPYGITYDINVTAITGYKSPSLSAHTAAHPIDTVSLVYQTETVTVTLTTSGE